MRRGSISPDSGMRRVRQSLEGRDAGGRGEGIIAKDTWRGCVRDRLRATEILVEFVLSCPFQVLSAGVV